MSLVNIGMGLPPVVGLFVSILLWHSGPLGFLALLYTPTAIVIAQIIIAFPVLTSLTVAAMQQINRLKLLALGASRSQILLHLLRQARLPILAAAMAFPRQKRSLGIREPETALTRGRRLELVDAQEASLADPAVALPDDPGLPAYPRLLDGTQ